MIADAAPWVTLGAWTTGQLAGVVIALMVVGFLLLGAEVFVIPGFGVAGVLGILSLGSGVAIAWASWGGGAGLTLLLGSLAGTALFVVLFFKSRVGNRLVLGSSLEDTHALSDADKRLIGQRGVAVTMLRPSGVAEFGDERVEVETDGDYIARGSPVLVTAMTMGRVVVELAPDASEASTGAGEATETTDG
jgi:membrane-bound serine protease (ClpP class)